MEMSERSTLRLLVLYLCQFAYNHLTAQGTSSIPSHRHESDDVSDVQLEDFDKYPKLSG